MNSIHENNALAFRPQQALPSADGIKSYGSSGLLASSADRGWSDLTVELRSHSGTIAWKGRQPHTEICVAVLGNDATVTRELNNITDRAVAERGTIWLSPSTVDHGLIDLSDPVPAVLHIYLPPSRLSPEHFGERLPLSKIASLRYETSFHDPLIAEIAYALASELQHETSAGRLLAETLVSSLAARLVHNHFGEAPRDLLSLASPKGLDKRRLARVIDYIEANLESELTIARLASVACLSEFHFARAFKAAVGRSPHRHVSARRLERAKDLLASREEALADIALRLRFSCQANFTRAFRHATGQTPAQYRHNIAASR